jgi:hypothetical protein
MELFRTMMLGSCNLLLFVLDPSEEFIPLPSRREKKDALAKGLDFGAIEPKATTFLLEMQKRIHTASFQFVRSRGKLHAALQLDASTITAADIVARERARNLLQVRAPVCLAHQVYVNRSRHPKLFSMKGDWLGMVLKALSVNEKRLGVAPPQPVPVSPYNDLTTVAFVYTRSVAHERWRVLAQRAEKEVTVAQSLPFCQPPGPVYHRLTSITYVEVLSLGLMVSVFAVATVKWACSRAAPEASWRFTVSVSCRWSGM